MICISTVGGYQRNRKVQQLEAIAAMGVLIMLEHHFAATAMLADAMVGLRGQDRQRIIN